MPETADAATTAASTEPALKPTLTVKFERKRGKKAGGKGEGAVQAQNRLLYLDPMTTLFARPGETVAPLSLCACASDESPGWLRIPTIERYLRRSDWTSLHSQGGWGNRKEDNGPSPRRELYE